MISHEDARAIVTSNLLPDWGSTAGTFTTPAWGWETSKFWVIPAGAKEWLEEANPEFQTLDDLIFLVDKETGQFIQTVAVSNLELLDEMKPYGDIPKNFQ
jgi:hypothetical protein